MSNPIATITMADGRVMTAELYPDKAPNTVNNFISLANKGFYDGLIFHRVIPGFMIQGGCPDGTGMGGPGYEINGEFAGNGFRQNDLKHTTGVLSMARTMAPNSAGSQFFIMVAPAPHLDGQYAAFGQVTEANIYARCAAYERATARLSEMLWSLQQILFLSADKRLARFLLDESGKLQSDELKLTQEQIARYMGSAREVVSRLLKYFSEAGMVRSGRGTVTITDREKLQRLAR